MAVLQLGLAGGRTVAEVLADARAGKPLTAGEWRMLAFYSFGTDEQRLVSDTDLPGVLAQLALAAPAADADTSTRLWLKAVAASDEGKGLKPDAALRERVAKVLADPAPGAPPCRRAGQRIRRDRARADGRRQRRACAAGGQLRRRPAPPGGRHRPVAWRPHLGPDRPHRAGPPGAAARQRQAGAAGRPGGRGQGPRGTRRPRDHRRLRAPGRDHRRRLCAGPGRPVGRQRCACSSPTWPAATRLIT